MWGVRGALKPPPPERRFQVAGTQVRAPERGFQVACTWVGVRGVQGVGVAKGSM